MVSMHSLFPLCLVYKGIRVYAVPVGEHNHLNNLPYPGPITTHIRGHIRGPNPWICPQIGGLLRNIADLGLFIKPRVISAIWAAYPYLGAILTPFRRAITTHNVLGIDEV